MNQKKTGENKIKGLKTSNVFTGQHPEWIERMTLLLQKQVSAIFGIRGCGMAATRYCQHHYHTSMVSARKNWHKREIVSSAQVAGQSWRLRNPWLLEKINRPNDSKEFILMFCDTWLQIYGKGLVFFDRSRFPQWLLNDEINLQEKKSRRVGGGNDKADGESLQLETEAHDVSQLGHIKWVRPHCGGNICRIRLQKLVEEVENSAWTHHCLFAWVKQKCKIIQKDNGRHDLFHVAARWAYSEGSVHRRSQQCMLPAQALCNEEQQTKVHTVWCTAW